ncbi:MAG TPA: hypothetical protein VGO34_03765 [Alphaproteobacteria bacterium]|jgi:hypothetical protein
MGYALKICCVLLSLGLSACGGAAVGIGSLVMQGLQMASGTTPSSSNASKNTAPFTRTDNAQEQQGLQDVTSKTVSESCTAIKEEAAASPEGQQSLLPSAQATGRRQCGYRNVCLPGTSRPVKMLICESPTPVAQDPAAPQANPG